MAEYLIRDTTLTDIADAIREKTGLTASLFPGAMPGYIRSIQAAAETGDIPEDIASEADRVVSAMLPKIGSNAVTFLAMSDMHEMGDGDHADGMILERYRRANRNAGQAAKRISDKIPLDFFANLGDFVWGGSSTSISDGVSAMVTARGYLQRVMEDNETFLTPGNHDPLTYSYGVTGGYLNRDILDGLTGGYRYLDLTDKKVRVICLNTADTANLTVSASGGTERISGEQLQWFAEALDLSGKADAGNWGILLLAHHPLDWGNIKPAANCLAAYLKGSTYSVTHNGTAVSYNFAGKNAAQVIGQFHGHVHGFRVDYIQDLTTGTPVPTTVRRVAIPNACFGRNNEYGENSGVDSNGIEFGEPDSYEKTDDGTGKNTAFCLVSVDLDKKRIYADCFGAGYDRIISYGGEEVVTYTVTNDLVNAANSNGTAVVAEGAQYSAGITAEEGFVIVSVTVTMGGEDVTDTVYSAGQISIPGVTGDIVITVRTAYETQYNVTNLVLTSEEQGSTAVYNGTGYKNGVYASENGDGADANCVATGWIPYTWKPENVLYIRGAAVTEASHVRFYGWKTKTTMSQNGYASGDKLSSFFAVEELEVDVYYRLTPVKSIEEINYLRISLIGTGENLIITVNEEILGDSGSQSCTNLVPLSTSDGTTVFNAPYGYENGKYLSSSTANTYSSDAACVATGSILLESGVQAIYIRGAAWDTGNSHARFYAGSAVGGLGYTIHADGSGSHAFDRFFTAETLGTNSYKWTLTADGQTYLWGKYYRISLVGTGENLIITHDEPIPDTE